MKKRISLLGLLVLAASAVLAFSPYENNLLTQSVKRVGLIASVKPGQLANMNKALQNLAEKRMVKALAKKDISNLSCYQKVLDDTSWVMVYFDYAGDNYLAAASAFESVAMRIEALKMAIIPHPRAKRYGTSWLQMEWISYIRGSLSSEKSKNAYAMVTTIKPEMEKEYRMLHQSVWPGVVDQMARGNNRNFSIFLVEIGAKIYEFFYVEYVGNDLKKDGERNRTDPANLRWWKLTDVCQNPLPGTKDIWTMMDKVESKKEVKK